MGLTGLSGKVAVVAGGATGIGAATATRLAAEGCLVVIGDVAVDTARRTADKIIVTGGTATAVGFDLADPDSVAALLDTGANTYGDIDAVFAVGADMGALRADTDIVDIDLDVWDRVMAVNLRGYVAAMKHAIPRLLARGGGAIVNMLLRGSLSGRACATGLCHRQGRNRCSDQACRVAMGQGGHPVQRRVAPGFTATEAIQSAPQWPELQSAALRRIRGPRVGAPDDIAALVAFLISQEGESINGAGDQHRRRHRPSDDRHR